MVREIRLSVRATNKLKKLLAFLETEWSVKSKKDFVVKLDDCLKKSRRFQIAFLNQKQLKA